MIILKWDQRDLSLRIIVINSLKSNEINIGFIIHERTRTHTHKQRYNYVYMSWWWWGWCCNWQRLGKCNQQAEFESHLYSLHTISRKYPRYRLKSRENWNLQPGLAATMREGLHWNLQPWLATTMREGLHWNNKNSD